MNRYILLPMVLVSYIMNAQTSSTIENNLCMKENSVLVMPVKDVITDATSTKSSQTGGSLTALSATLGVSTMIFTFQKSLQWEKDASRKEKIQTLLAKLKEELKSISCFVDGDREIYHQFLAAGKLPSGTEKEKLQKDSTFHAALKSATELPISVSKHINAVLELTQNSVDLCSAKVITDLNAATSMLLGAEDAMLVFAKYNAEGLSETESKFFLDQCQSVTKTRKLLQSKITSEIAKRGNKK